MGSARLSIGIVAADRLVPNSIECAPGTGLANVRNSQQDQAVMHSVHEIVEEAKLLPVPERRRLLHAIEDSLAKDEEQEAVPVPPGGRYARLLALAGTMHSDHTDVSGDKYKHLAEIYADNHETRR